MEFVSWDDDIPNIWKFIKFMFQTTNQYRWFSYWNAHWCWISPSLTPIIRLRAGSISAAAQPTAASLGTRKQRLGLWIPKNMWFFFGKINIWDHMRSYLVGGAITILKNISQWLSHIWNGRKCLTPPTRYVFMEKGLRISRTWDRKWFQQQSEIGSREAVIHGCGGSSHASLWKQLTEIWRPMKFGKSTLKWHLDPPSKQRWKQVSNYYVPPQRIVFAVCHCSYSWAVTLKVQVQYKQNEWAI